MGQLSRRCGNELLWSDFFTYHEHDDDDGDGDGKSVMVLLLYACGRSFFDRVDAWLGSSSG